MALAAVTAEDLEFERKLQSMEVTGPDIEPGPRTELKKEKAYPLLLSEHVEDYEPAKTHAELIEQVHLAKQYGCDSIEADPKIIRQLTLKSGYPDDVGFFFFQDVRVWIPGFYETHAGNDKLTFEQKIFGKSPISIHPVMDLGEKPK